MNTPLYSNVDSDALMAASGPFFRASDRQLKRHFPTPKLVRLNKCGDTIPD
jgi:hypothetical protein